jgi:hypothetical protein
MPSGDAVDYKWFRYTQNDGTFRSVKVDKTWGDDADSGFAAFNVADPVLMVSGTEHPRYVMMQDPATGRKKKLPCGTKDATAFTDPAFTQTTKYRGLAGAVTLAAIYTRDEIIRRPRAIISAAEPSTA